MPSTALPQWLSGPAVASSGELDPVLLVVSTRASVTRC